MMAALAKIGEDGKITAGDGYDEDARAHGVSWYLMILSNPKVWSVSEDSIIDAIALTPENLTQYGPSYFMLEYFLGYIKEYDIATRVIDGKTYVAVYLCIEK